MLPRRWSELQPLLNRALDGDREQREALLQALRLQDPELADSLNALLLSHDRAEDEGFLLQTPGAALQPAPLSGLKLGPWTLLQPLGEGGMGSVWLARRDDGRFQGQAAVKLLNLTLSGPMRTERFRREGDILARLAHPHIARLLDAGVTPTGQPYLVLEHVAGSTIDTWCDNQQLGVDARIDLFLFLLQAVAHAHSHLVVHRDIKPSNVMVSDDGQVKLLDFGIAKLMAADTDTQDSRLTREVGAMLSPAYAAPEQLQGGDITTATDVYALGVLLFLLLAGRHPHADDGPTVSDALRRSALQDAPFMSAGKPDAATATVRGNTPAGLQRQLRGDLDNIVAKALQREPPQRYASVAVFADDLRRHRQQQPVLARAPSLGYRALRFVQRQRAPVAVAAVAAAVLAVVGTQAWQQQQLAQQNRLRAQTVDGLLQSLFDGMSPDVAANRSFSARELLDRGQSFLEQNDTLDSQTRHTARLRMAGLYRDIGAYEPAAAMYAVDLARATQADQPRERVEALWNLADLKLKQREFQHAQSLLDVLAPLTQQSLAGDDRAIGRLALLQGERLLGTGRSREAAAAYAQADAHLARAQPQDLELLARSAQSHGWASRLAGDIEGAGGHLRRAAAHYGQMGERANVDRLNLEVQIGALDNWSGRHEQAAQRLTRTHAELVSRLGPQHSLPVLATSELAVAELRQGHFVQARAWLQQLRGSTGPGDRWRDSYAAALEARIRMYEGASAQAEPALQALLVAKEREEGRASGQTEPLRRLHGEALLRLGRNAEALSVLRDNADKLTTLNKTAQHNSVAATQVLLGCALARQGDLPAATTLWQQAAPLLQQQLGPQHPFALVAAAYAALVDPASSPPDRQALAERLQQQMGWQDGAPELARWLREPGSARLWSRLPVVL